ncbi:MAG: RDD family protein [Desulfuromonadales bacterium]|nr:RDD family protein [Desulfuromonadales bacterium]
MNDPIIQPNNSAEIKANRNLSIWVGVLGLVGFGLCYALFFALMFLQPGLIFKLIPMPAITAAAISDGEQTYLLTDKIDMSSVDPRQERPPEVKHLLSLLTGTEPGTAQEIPAYAQAIGAKGRLLFLEPGGYRMYDGSRWVDKRADAIGNDPRGILAPAGLYVLSNHDSGPRLNLITSETTLPLPLPPEFLAVEQQECLCAKLALYQGDLCLFWKGDETLSWAILDGETWSAVATWPFSGGYDVISDDSNLYLFQREGEGLERTISYLVFANAAWSEPRQLPIKSGFTDWDAFIEQGKLKIFVQQLMTQTLYTIKEETLVDPIRLKGPFDPSPWIGRGAVLVIFGNGLSLLAIFAISAGIGRFKKRIWRDGDVEYEFASLFRRSLAMILDNLLLFVAPLLVMALALPGFDEIPGNPVRFMLTIFSALALFFVGGFLYHSLLEGLYGQTLGKKICGIRVLKADFSPCGVAAGFVRNLLRIADAFFYYLVSIIAMAANLKWQRVGDVVADTVVVKVRKGE